MFKKGLGDLVWLEVGTLEKNWLEWRLRNHRGTYFWLAQNPRSKNLDFILSTLGHPQVLLSRGLARPDMVLVLVVSMGA